MESPSYTPYLLRLGYFTNAITGRTRIIQGCTVTDNDRDGTSVALGSGPLRGGVVE